MSSAVLIFLFLAGASGASHAPVAIKDKMEFYRIHGATVRELKDQFHTLGPVDGNEGKRFAARTQWDITWHYRYRREGGRCRIDRFDVSLSTVTILPEWADKARGTPALRAGWTSFMAGLKTHESGHRSNGIAAAIAVEKLIDGAAPTMDCRVLGNDIDTAAHAAIGRSNQADIDYDRATAHGAAQGALLREKGTEAINSG